MTTETSPAPQPQKTSSAYAGVCRVMALAFDDFARRIDADLEARDQRARDRGAFNHPSRIRVSDAEAALRSVSEHAKATAGYLKEQASA